MVKRIIKTIHRKFFGGKKKVEKKSQEKCSQPSENKKRTSAKGKRPQHGKPNERKDQKSKKKWSLKDFQVPEKEDELRFHDFELPLPVMHAVHDLGFKYCTPIQAKVLNYTRSGRNIAGRAQTGTGKTAAFLVSILAQFLGNKDRPKPGSPRALIIAPTRELVIQIAKDAQDLAKHTPFRCLAVYGGTEFEKQQNELKRHSIDIIAATPGRLLDFKRRGVLDLKQIEVLVIDEADRMLDMGFIPDVKSIIRATPPKDRRQTMLFSATLTDDVLRLASQWMPDPIICEIEPETVAAKTITQIVYIVRAREKFRLLHNILKKEVKGGRALIFGNRRDSTKRLVDNLRKHNIRCEYLSGIVRQEKRMKVLEDFRSGKVKIVVATDVAGRGLHVDDIGHVINYEFPYEPEDYVHRIGRTARAGVEGTAISFACEEESFVIPEIEEYIKESLKCTVPGPELLEDL